MAVGFPKHRIGRSPTAGASRLLFAASYGATPQNLWCDGLDTVRSTEKSHSRVPEELLYDTPVRGSTWAAAAVLFRFLRHAVAAVFSS